MTVTKDKIRSVIYRFRWKKTLTSFMLDIWIRKRTIILPAVIVACIPNGISSNDSSGVSHTKGNKNPILY